MVSDSKKTTVQAIIGGTVVDPSNNIHDQFNVFIENGLISEVSKRAPTGSEGVVDASGLIVAPGFIDMHVHLREPGQEYKEDIESGCRAAAAGGFTCICCMPNTTPVNDSAEVTRTILERVGEVSSISVLPVGALTKGSKGKELADFEGMMKEGVRVFSDDGGCVQDRELMKRVFVFAKENDCLIVDHAEDFSISGRESENVIIERDIELARETGAHIHIAHLSTKESVEMIRQAKANGVPITCEVTPHHLTLTEDAVEEYGPNAIMKPPLRTKEDRKALIERLADGTIDAIATDHAPHAASEKEDIKTAAFGIIGMETMLPVCLKLVHNSRITMDRFIDAVSCSPARILGLKEKGNLAVGSEADITIFSPDEPITIDASKFQSKSRNCPFNGWKEKGRVIATVSKGLKIS
jgi:dihydroorotase